MTKFNLSMYGEVTRHFPYETARVRGALIEVKETVYPDPVAVWHRELAQAAGLSHPDNKEVFELTHENGTKLYVQFWDCRLTIGTSVEPRRRPA